MELYELNYQLNESLITKKEYLSAIDNLNYAYYESSLDGKSIFLTGYCEGMKDKILNNKK